MAEISFEVKQEALTVVKNTPIEANFDECKAALKEMIAPYQSMIVTEDGVANAKNDRARIRKVASGIDEMRKTVKKAYTEPLKAFEDKCKELVGICESGSNNLDGQIKAFEEREADAKIARLREVYDASDNLVEKDFCPWEAVYNAKWRNKTYSEDDAKGEIANALLKAREDIETIRSLEEIDRPALLTEYKRCRDVGQVIRLANTLKLQRIEEQRRAEEVRARQEAENSRKAKEVIAAARKPAEDVAIGVDLAQGESMTVGTPIRIIDMRVWGTEAAFAKLKAYMDSAGLKYGPVPEK